MKHLHLTNCLSLAIGFLFHLSAHASPDGEAAGSGLSLGAPFVDHAVLQQGIELPVWGTAPAGTAVTVEFAGQTRKAVADGDHQWRIRLAPLVAEPLTSVHEPLAGKTLHVHARIKPLIGYGIRGAFWYQGEANDTEGPEYLTKMRMLIEDWRDLWGQGDFPFYYV